MNKYQKIGTGLIVGPPIGLFLVVTVYAISNFVLLQLLAVTPQAAGSIETATPLPIIIGNIINVLLGFLGILFLLGIVIGIPVGIILMLKKEYDPKAKYDVRSGKGKESIIPEEIKGWNWGAAGLPFFWGIFHSVWICLLCFIPVINWFWWIFMGVYGSEWAWKKQRWASVSEFNDAQRKWMPWGIIFFIINVVGWLIYFVSVSSK